MADIVLTTLNAKYIHAAFGLRYLMANLGPLRERASLLEFTISQKPTEICELLLAQQPRIIGIGVYIWNVVLVTELVGILKRLRPDVVVALGGPEASHEIDGQPITRMADYVIAGEADLEFAALCRQLLSGQRPAAKVIRPAPPNLDCLALPYGLYDQKDIEERTIYLEASRGCLFRCEFCLSSLDAQVRRFPLPRLFDSWQTLMNRGARRFKFVDRTFNLDVTVCQSILEFFLERHQPGLFLHFEMIPDRFPDKLRELAARFPAGALKFEIGIQTFNAEVAERIQRRQDISRLEDNFKFLRDRTSAHLHADLIAGLPGESIDSFGAGFDRLISLRPHEIQIELLKRLRGAPISRHDTEWQMIYNPQPPYEILQNKSIDFMNMQRLRRFSEAWDVVANRGNFIETTSLLWGKNMPPFQGFMRWADWLWQRLGRTHSIALIRLAEMLFIYLTEELDEDPRQAAQVIWLDYRRSGRSDKPIFLRRWIEDAASLK